MPDRKREKKPNPQLLQRRQCCLGRLIFLAMTKGCDPVSFVAKATIYGKIILTYNNIL